MSKAILIANPKGGVGKSTICDELVYGLRRRGYRVAYVNLDNQGGSSHEASGSTEGCDYVVVDTPGALTEELRDWMDASDIVLIPTLASKRDVDRLRQTWAVAKAVSQDHRERGDDPLYGGLVLNRFNPRALIDQAYVDMVRAEGMHVFGWLPDTTQIKQAEMQGVSVVEHAPHSRYTAQIESIVDAVIKRMEF